MKVIGHRGAAAMAPENTWESFDLALKLGVNAIETDVRKTKDGRFILIHDQDLDRTTNGVGLVKNTLWSQIVSLNAGSWFDIAYDGAKVPLLQETLELYGQKTHLVLEIKDSGIELEALEMVQRLNLIDCVTFTSFDFAVVQNIKEQCPEVNLEWLMTQSDGEKMEKALTIGVNQISLSASFISQDLVSQWNAIALPVYIWDVTDSQVMISAMKAGVVGMTVDAPHLLLNILDR